MFEMSSVSCNAGSQSLVPFPDCTVDHLLIKTVPLLLNALAQLFHVLDQVPVNVPAESPTICANLVDQNLIILHFDPVTLKSWSNQNSLYQLVHTGQMHLRCKFGDHRSVTCRDNTHMSIFYNELKPSEIGQGDLFLALRSGFLVGLCKQDYKSLCAAVTIYATLSPK